MEQDPTSDSVPPPDKSRVLDIRPLRSLTPVFPNAPGMSTFGNSQATPFVCVPPTGPFPPGVAPLYPFSVEHGAYSHQQTPGGVPNQPGSYGGIPSPVPLNAFRTPQSAAVNGHVGGSKRAAKSRVVEDDGYGDSQNQGDGYGNDDDGSAAGKKRNRSRKKKSYQQGEFADIDVDAEAKQLLTLFKLMQFDDGRKASGDRDTVTDILVVFNLLRRKLAQLDETKDADPGTNKRPDLRASTTLMKNLGIRTNCLKRIGNVPGIAIGDIFFFRMELCLVGLHAPSMAGIDYMSVRVTRDEEPVAVSIVSSGGYDDEGNDGDVLIYSGQGGVQRRDGQMFDQKLERGNLAMEKSVHKGNEIRVIRGLKDVVTGSGKIYIYDGLYKIQESWTERNQSGCQVFKYKLVRLPGQPPAFTLWKSVQQWRDGVTSRTGVILPDLTSGAESQPVSLVNDVDDEKGPSYFTYIPALKYAKPFHAHQLSPGCHCSGGCQPGDLNCSCIQKMGSHLPYSPLGVLFTYKSLIHECGLACSCPPNCRNRLSQAGLKVRLEVFKTRNKGWGLRSWDPIRSGAFVCEYAGDVVDASRLREIGSDNEDGYLFDATRTYESLEHTIDPNDAAQVPFPLVISSKNNGNVARFMNHSCSPNVFWQPVLRQSNNEAYLHIAFFSINHIPPLQELTFDYGIVSDQAGFRRKKCLCGSSKCRGFFY